MPLNVITMGWTITNNIDLTITISKCRTNIKQVILNYLGLLSGYFYHINKMITLPVTVIALFKFN
jgi:hypothetical protein